MNRLALLAATSVVALCLTACGEHAAKKEETATVTTETTKTTEAAPAAEAEKAAPAAQEHAPSEAEAAGASAQE